MVRLCQFLSSEMHPKLLGQAEIEGLKPSKLQAAPIIVHVVR